MIDYENKTLIYGQIIGDLLLRGDITFEAFGWINPTVDMVVESSCFTDDSFVMSVYDYNWNCGPSEAVRRELVDLLISRKISFKPDFDVEAMCRERQYCSH